MLTCRSITPFKVSINLCTIVKNSNIILDLPIGNAVVTFRFIFSHDRLAAYSHRLSVHSSTMRVLCNKAIMNQTNFRNALF
jgi:hypothetical protein